MCDNLRWLAPLALLLGVSAMVGCGSSSGIGVSGSVSYRDGTPIENGSIVFDPVEANLSPRVATTIRDGKFDLSRSEGPWPGEYIVRVYGETSTVGLDDPRQFAEHGEKLLQINPVSATYNDRSKLRAAVSSDHREFQFTVERATAAN